MAAVAHSPEFAKRTGVSMDVGSEFMEADKGRKFRTGKPSPKAGLNKQKTHHGDKQLPNAMLNKYIGRKEGGIMKAVDSKKNPGLAKLPTEVRNKMGYMKKGGMAHDDAKADMKMDKSQDKSMIKKAFKQHDMQEHKGGKGTKLALKNGGSTVKKMASGGLAAGHKSANGIAKKGLTKGKQIKMSHGGKC